MEMVKRGFGLGIAAVLLTCAVMVMLPLASSKKYRVGDSDGWNQGINYTLWAGNHTFYLGDWLFFTYDRNQMDILEVNKTGYETCDASHPVHNWTTGAGRDVVPLNVTRNYYFITSKGGCYGGMKLAVHVLKPPPPPSASPSKEKSDAPRSTYKSLYVVPAAFAVAAVWDTFLQLCW